MMTIRMTPLSGAVLAVLVWLVPSPNLALGKPVELHRRYDPGRTSYIERKENIVQKSVSPRGEQEYTISRLSGVWERVEPPADGKTRIVLTFDRATQRWETSRMGTFLFDTDDPGHEEATALFGLLLKPMMGMSMTMDVDGSGDVVSFTGMEAINEKVSEGAVANVFYQQLARDLTDERAKETWGTDPLLIYPKKEVREGDTWKASASSVRPSIGTVLQEYEYKLNRIGTEQGREVAIISITGELTRKPDPDEAEGAGIEMNGSVTGSATYDIALGRVASECVVAQVEMKMPLPSAPDQEEPQFNNVTATITTTVTVMTEDQRKKQKADARKTAEERRRSEDAETPAGDEALTDTGAGGAPDKDWTQWGGPRRDFKVNTRGLAKRWPKGGPKKLWSRDLGDGYSSIITDGEVLYTMYWIPDEDALKQAAAAKLDAEKETTVQGSADDDAEAADSKEADAKKDDSGDEAESEEDPEEAARRKGAEAVVALDAKTGKTLWEYKYPAIWDSDMSIEYGPGPNATPLIAGDRIFAVGAMVDLVCLDRKTGKLLWEHDLHEEYEAATLRYGYGVNPVVHKDLLIVPIGGEGHSVVAFKMDDGSVAWKKQDFGPAYGAPQIITLDGEDQLLVVRKTGIAGLNPTTGELLWSHDHGEGANISMPVFGEDNIVFISAAYGVGARGIKLVRKDGKTTTEELWFNPKMRIHHGNAVRLGDVIIGSSGDFGAAFITALEAATGKVLWKKRGFSKATFVYADGKLIVLDEDGKCALTTPGKKSLKVHDTVTLCKRNSWTGPTLVGTRLYLRDRKQIMALDVGEAAD